jgi:hypothetical protein
MIPIENSQPITVQLQQIDQAFGKSFAPLVDREEADSLGDPVRMQPFDGA